MYTPKDQYKSTMLKLKDSQLTPSMVREIAPCHAHGTVYTNAMLNAASDYELLQLAEHTMNIEFPGKVSLSDAKIAANDRVFELSKQFQDFFSRREQIQNEMYQIECDYNDAVRAANLLENALEIATKGE